MIEALLSISSNSSFASKYILKDFEFVRAIVDNFPTHESVVLEILNNIIYTDDEVNEVFQIKIENSKGN